MWNACYDTAIHTNAVTETPLEKSEQKSTKQIFIPIACCSNILGMWRSVDRVQTDKQQSLASMAAIVLIYDLVITNFGFPPCGYNSADSRPLSNALYYHRSVDTYKVLSSNVPLEQRYSVDISMFFSFWWHTVQRNTFFHWTLSLCFFFIWHTTGIYTLHICMVGNTRSFAQSNFTARCSEHVVDWRVRITASTATAVSRHIIHVQCLFCACLAAPELHYEHIFTQFR